MGPRQALAANLEHGAAAISEFQLALVPGLLQTRGYSEARVQADPSASHAGFNPAVALDARQQRQHHLAGPDGPEYQAVLDELALRRHAVPPAVLQDQILHLVTLARTNPRITIRLLPIEAHIIGQAVPRSAFSLYHYPDPDDPVVVAVDTMTEDLVVLDPPIVAQYQHLYQRLRAAAHTPQRTIDLLTDLAARPTDLGVAV